MIRLRQLIGKHEALRLKPYDDATGKELKRGDVIKGKISIGVGRNLSDLGLTKDEALELFQHDIDRTIGELYSTFAWFGSLDHVRQDALTDMCFNMGLTRFLGFHDMIGFLKEQRYSDAADALLDSKYARTHPTRAAELAAMLRTGLYQEDDDSSTQ